MNKAIIIIPIYKNSPDEFEIISLMQCLKVLHRYKICIVTYDSLDISYYRNELQKFGVDFIFEFFDKEYFNDITGYNRLMLSLEFYIRFVQYHYILIYQLDAYVFRDELEEWCDKGYYYIGAPWFDLEGSTESKEVVAIGNGGFSLRRTALFIDIIENLATIYYLEKFKTMNQVKFFLHIYSFLKNYLKSRKVIERIDFETYQEDGFWYIMGCKIMEIQNSKNFLVKRLLRKHISQVRFVDIETAIKFSFETQPEILFSKNNNTLPFGCHAWMKHNYQDFYSKYIF